MPDPLGTTTAGVVELEESVPLSGKKGRAWVSVGESGFSYERTERAVVLVERSYTGESHATNAAALMPWLVLSEAGTA